MSQIPRKPRIALMGEFSAGKSTLSNLLLGARPLPEKVTATRLSPVWMSQGTDAPYRVDVDGSEEAVSLEQLETIPVEETRVIRLFFEADVLQICDLIDFPGISDPNMSSDVWQRMVPEVDAVLWCTHATQAWRQSEAAAWEMIPDHVRAHSALLITRFDKLTTDRDKYRVLTRVKKETDGLFAGTFPISLTEALAAGEDYDAFEASGGGALLEYLLPMVDKLTAEIADGPQDAPVAMFNHSESAEAASAEPDGPAEAPTSPAPSYAAPEPAHASASIEVDPVSAAVASETVEPSEEPAVVAAIVPRRVRATGGPRPVRPSRPIPTGVVREEPQETPRPTTVAVGASKLRSIFRNGDDNEVA